MEDDDDDDGEKKRWVGKWPNRDWVIEIRGIPSGDHNLKHDVILRTDLGIHDELLKQAAAAHGYAELIAYRVNNTFVHFCIRENLERKNTIR